MDKLLSKLHYIDESNEVRNLILEYYKDFYLGKTVKIEIDNQEFIFMFSYYNYDLINKHFLLRSNLIVGIDRLLVLLQSKGQVKIIIEDNIISEKIQEVKLNQFQSSNHIEYELSIVFEKEIAIVNSNSQSDE